MPRRTEEERPSELADVVAAVSRGAFPAEILREKRRDVTTARVTLPTDETVIVKLWRRTGFKGGVGRALGTNSAQREWQALCVLHHEGVAVPRPLTFLDLRSHHAVHTEAVVVEDLGPCEWSVEIPRRLLERGDDQGLLEFETEVLEITDGVLKTGIVDLDHSLMNIIQAPGGRLYRVDLELARRPVVSRRKRLVGRMLGRLVGTYIFSVQPDVDRVERFAGSIARLHRVDPRTLLETRREVERLLDEQKRERGLTFDVPLPW